MIVDDIKRRYKATLFGYVFKDRERFIDLYEACSGKRLDASDITCFDLDSDVVQRERYNDVSFITNDNRLIYLVEHQSFISANLAVKIGAYFFSLLMLWVEHKGINIHSETEIQFPKPELYVVYNGKKQYSKGYEVYDCGEFMRIRVPVIDIRFNALKDKNAGNYLAGYAYLQHEYERKLGEGLPELDAFEYAVQQCKLKGYLKGIVEKEDFTAVNIDLFSYDNQLRAEGEARGKAEGEANKAIAIAKKMLAEGEPVEKIILYTGLSREEVEGLRDVLQAGKS
jgi:hypothetical protein